MNALADTMVAHHPASLALDRVADVLAETLPAGSRIALCWNDAELGGGACATPAAEDLHEQARSALRRRATQRADGDIVESWREAGTSVSIAAGLSQPLAPALRKAWLAMARQTIRAMLAQGRTQARIESLQKSQCLQRALYEIADLAGSGREMQDMLERIHAVVGDLMSAENFYIVLYDDLRERVRFQYFADQHDPFVADPSHDFEVAQLNNSLTVALLHHGRALHGPSQVIRDALGVPRDAAHGPDSADWLGVPMRRDGRVVGAIVVQSYDRPDCYLDESRALLEFVAQHILTALDRRQIRDQLERRVLVRTQELQHANAVLQGEIIERQRGERLQRALYRITELSTLSGSLERFYADVHQIVGELLYAHNFYIALLSADGEQIEFPYSVDERDEARANRRIGNGLTEYVLATGTPLLADRGSIAQLEAAGVVRSRGAYAYCWLGVPLHRDGVVVGVIAVQSYTAERAFAPRDQSLLTFVAHHIDGALERKRAQDSLKFAHTVLETRVESRTRELEAANRELRSQIGERIRAEQQLNFQARHDGLTGLPNRVHLLDRLDVAILQMAEPKRPPFAVLFLDLDRFKLVNDSAGHAAGDEMLIQAGRRIGALLADSDVVARLGGDEFAVLLAEVTDGADALARASRILAALGQPMWIAERELFPSASIGITLWQPDYREGHELLRDADAAMYRAKALGRDRSALFDARMREESIRLLELEADLRRAINSDEFQPYFQPIVQLDDGVVVGHEALLRWNHATRGTLAPADFIGVGEDSGLIEQVDWLMYRHVLTWMSRNSSGYVSINVSPRHFRHDNFAQRLLEIVDAQGVDASRLRIEITEVALLEDAPRVLRMLETLRDRGVLAVLDDFGTGFSAMSYLHRFPIHSLKIDQSFVAGLDGETSAESLALVRAILVLSRTLAIDAVGEGIETVQQRDVLMQLGCRYGQGFLFGQPQPTAAANFAVKAKSKADRNADTEAKGNAKPTRSRRGATSGKH